MRIKKELLGPESKLGVGRALLSVEPDRPQPARGGEMKNRGRLTVTSATANSDGEERTRSVASSHTAFRSRGRESMYRLPSVLIMYDCTERSVRSSRIARTTSMRSKLSSLS